MKEDDRRSREASSRLNAHRRLLIGLVVAAAVGFLMPASLPAAARFAIAWDSAVLTFLLTTWWVVADCPPEEMRETVLANDQGRVGILLLVLLAVCASLAEIFLLMQNAKDQGPPPAQVVLALGTAALTIPVG